MFNIKPNRRGLIQLLVISLGITTLINGILFTFNINQSVTQPIKPEYPLLPSSWMIGLIWTVLIGFMAYTQWLLIKKTRDRALLSIVPILFLNCVLYPLYSQGFTNDFNQLIGNLFTITYAAFITGRIRSITKFGSNLMLMVTLWALFATFATSKLI
ncbi:tryptophan-rich sensory protein [Candidatus Methylopumilus rimovensis]|uniref:Tryptophan-rich sensory protein n=1 Tax=Candidatus Methylopumilus rimovensis TaxID=2588535 RepID=A0AAE6FS15_9PROT|nr:tryptophan-rich sensory protein [Candidatus Methylopumilus rimovensis]QDD12948.1 tryptophan-rich sensory protein [Candidatus Methylopumilus rimovensis]